MIPAISRNSVDLPAPLGPISPRISPAATSMSTPSTATKPPKRFVSPRPARIGSGTAGSAATSAIGLRLARRSFREPALQRGRDPEDPARLEYDDRDQQ